MKTDDGKKTNDEEKTHDELNKIQQEKKNGFDK